MQFNKVKKIKKMAQQAELLKTKEEPLQEETVPKNEKRLDSLFSKPKVRTDDIEVLIEDEEEVVRKQQETAIKSENQAKQNGKVVNGKENGKLNKENAEENGIVNSETFQNYLENEKARKEQLLQKMRKVKRTIAFPNSILEPVQTVHLENDLIGRMGRCFCIHRVNEAMVLSDSAFAIEKQKSGFDPSEFIVKVLQYLETPQYLRKRLFPLSPLLKNAGLLNPLECQHHLKQDEICEYREGVVLNRPIREKDGSWVDIGLLKVK